jgi:hypothetical protein
MRTKLPRVGAKYLLRVSAAQPALKRQEWKVSWPASLIASMMDCGVIPGNVSILVLSMPSVLESVVVSVSGIEVENEPPTLSVV